MPKHEIRLHNSLTHSVDPVRTAKPDILDIYTCGPTVYNFAHIGNLRTFTVYDLLRRVFTAAGYTVNHCMNITDVEDKIIRDSQRNLPDDASQEERHKAMRRLTEKYTGVFLADLKALSILPPTHMPKATDHIDNMIGLVQGLIEKGMAYESDGSVYFKISAFPQYGRLARLDHGQMKTGTRVDVDEYEREAVQDFVLWKAAKPGEPYWDSPWGHGRPGWHIECSAMSLNIFGDTLDIHAGGVDLMFPHHENEIAQSEGFLGKPWTTCWVHSEFLNVNNDKMSKSKGNFHTLPDLVEQGMVPEHFRFAVLSNHYRKQMNFTHDVMAAAGAALQRIRTFRRRMEKEPVRERSEIDMALHNRVDQAREQFWTALCHDLNTPEALAAIFELVTEMNAEDDERGLSRIAKKEILNFLDEADSIFALWPSEVSDEDSLQQEARILIQARREARVAKDWKRSDALRAKILELGYVLEDKKDGTVEWRRA